jgi:uncharacterized protein (TIGR02246 family)
MVMKQILFSMLFFLAVTDAVFAQNSTDEKHVEAGVEALILSWNNHDYSDMKNYATEDCEWVNIVGMHWKNRNEVQYAHDVFHKVMFKTTSLSKNATKIRFLTTDVAIVHLNYHVGAYTTPSGHQYPEADNLSTLVFVKKQDKWLLTTGQNVVIDDKAQKSNPVKKG